MANVKNSKQAIVAGDVRPSQIIWTYGPGAVIDLQRTSVIAMGLQDWGTMRQWELSHETVNEPRLLEQVRKFMPYVKELRLPPLATENPFGAEAYKNREGMPVGIFPRWYRCRVCGLLGSIDEGAVFEIIGRDAQTLRVVHKNCPKLTSKRVADAQAVPARFLIACKSGHISDFPWREYVHGGLTTCHQSLTFKESRSSLQTENLFVSCACGARKSMAQAFGKSAFLPKCPGYHPHFGKSSKLQNCNEKPQTLMLGASNGWFPKVVSVLAIPLQRYGSASTLQEKILAAVPILQKFIIKSLEDLEYVSRMPIFSEQLPSLVDFPAEEIWNEYQAYLANPTAYKENLNKCNGSDDVKLPEWRSFTLQQLPYSADEFEVSDAGIPQGFENTISRVIAVTRLKEVRALTGFTRIVGEDPLSSLNKKPKVVPLSADKTPWLPAMETRGEGIFIQFNEEVIQTWEQCPVVKERGAILQRAHAIWRRARNLGPGRFPGTRFVLLHTFAHILIRELSLACGYSAASIRERIYSSSDLHEPMAGVLLYTAANDSDGTLGGLVDLSKPENLGPLMRECLTRAMLCSSDPLCCEYNPDNQKDGGILDLHLAACHACSYVSETSCEFGNHFLDRALLVPTLVGVEPAFFKLGASVS